MASRSAQTPKKEAKVPDDKPGQESVPITSMKGAVSYQRVSTKGQDFPRQKRARDKWLAKHPEYELLTTKRDLMSGRKKNRFEWFIHDPKKFPPGTVLLVEDINRFSRMEVEDGIRELLGIFVRGLAIAVCPYEDDEFSDWESLGVITSLNRGGKKIFEELERARRESERKRERRVDARDRKYEAIREATSTRRLSPGANQKRPGRSRSRWIWTPRATTAAASSNPTSTGR